MEELHVCWSGDDGSRAGDSGKVACLVVRMRQSLAHLVISVVLEALRLQARKSRVKKDARLVPSPLFQQLLHRTFLSSPSLLPLHMTALRPSFFPLNATLLAALS